MSSRLTWRRVLATGLAGAAVLAGAAGPAGASPARAGNDGTADAPDLTFVQANIKTGMPVPDFQADVRKVLAPQPDFVTYNEVMFRNDLVMAPDGYDIYRSMRNRYTAETAVAWRSDRWTPVEHGTSMISDWRGKPPGREVEIGRRFANWVTLQGTDGRVVSVVATHIAPLSKGMPDLLRPSMTRLGALVDRLAAAGPVLVGGDFNVQYQSGRYPQDILTAHDMVPTFDRLGKVPTGDHFGATIDYVFDRGIDVLAPEQQRTVELNSDHDAVVAGFGWQVDLPQQTQVVRNDPQGDATARGAVLAGLIGGVRSAEPGSLVSLVTTRFDLYRLSRQLQRAVARGVHVHLRVVGNRETTRQHRFAKAIARSGDRGSWVRQCTDRCRDAWAAAEAPRGFMMVSDDTGRWTARYDTNRKLAGDLVARPSLLRIDIGEIAVQDGAKILQSLR